MKDRATTQAARLAQQRAADAQKRATERNAPRIEAIRARTTEALERMQPKVQAARARAQELRQRLEIERLDDC
jgi:hypothetical protein